MASQTFIPEDEFVIQLNVPNGKHTAGKIWRDITQPSEVEHCIVVRKTEEPYQKDQVFYVYLALSEKGLDPKNLNPPPTDVLFKASDLTTDVDGVSGDTTKPHDESVAQGMIAYLIAYQKDPVDISTDPEFDVKVSGDFSKGTRTVEIGGVVHSLVDKVPTRDSIPQPSAQQNFKSGTFYRSYL